MTKLKEKRIPRKKRLNLSAQEQLLFEIFRAKGGQAPLAHKLGLKLQTPHNWSATGQVPFKHILKVSELLNVDPYALNYKGYTEMTGVVKPWKDVVMGCLFLPLNIRKLILSKK